MVVFFRSARTGSRVFGTDSLNQLFRAAPRWKFLFFTEFTLSDGGAAMMNRADLNTWKGQTGIAFRVKSIDKPRFTLETDELNQYNKKHLIYKKLDYSDVSVKLHDTNDNSVLTMWVDYFTYFYGDSRLKNNSAYSASPVDPKFPLENGWGFSPIIDTTNFFSKVSVYAFYARTYTKFSYINPRITSIDWGQKDYYSNDPDEVTITFKYESVEYEKFGQPMSATDLERFGWSDQDQLTIPIAGIIRDSPNQPRIFRDQNIPAQTFNVQSQPERSSQLKTIINRDPKTGEEQTIVINEAQQNQIKQQGGTVIPPTGNFGGSKPQFGPLFKPLEIRGVNAPALTTDQSITANAADMERQQFFNRIIGLR